MTLTRFEDLECWQEARSLIRKDYTATRDGAFKKDLQCIICLGYKGYMTGGRLRWVKSACWRARTA